MYPATRATQAIRAALVPHPAHRLAPGAELAATLVRQHRLGAQSGIDHTHTPDRHLAQGRLLLDAALLLLPFPVQERLSAGEGGTHHPFRVLARQPRSVPRVAETLVRYHIPVLARPLPVEPLELEATHAQPRPQLDVPRLGIEVTPARRRHLVDAGEATLDPQPALSRVLLHREKQAQGADAPLQDPSPVLHLQDEQDLLSEPNDVRAVTPLLQKYHVLDHHLAAHKSPAIPLLVDPSPLLRAAKWTSTTFIPVVEVY